MRPVRLTLKGFTSFREETTVDFRDRDLFVITGPTGAGKSSLLDAITWALYGQVPRVGRSAAQLQTHGEPSMWVHFEFSTRGGQYRVSRRRPATIGTRLERLDEDGHWEPLADRSAAVTSQVTEILGLDYTTFTRTVLLPQGRFDAFLRGEQRERRDILSNLLGLGVYSDARGIAGRRASDAQRDAQTIREQRDALQLATPEEVMQLETTRATAERASRELTGRRAALQALGELARTMGDRDRDANTSREAADTASSALKAARGDVRSNEAAAATATISLERADQQIAELGYDSEAHAALRDRVVLLERADRERRALTDAEGELESAQHALDATRDDERTAAASSTAATSEASASEAACSLAGETLSLAAAGAQRAATRMRDELQQLVDRRDGLLAQASEHTELARQLGGLHDQHRAASARHRAALHAAEVAVEAVNAADAAAISADQAREAARALVIEQRTDLEGVRRSEQAADLRSVLKAGDPCPVCGQPIAELAGVEASADLAAAEHALNDREAELGGAERASQERHEASAVAQANARAAARTVVQAEREMNELVQQIGFAGVTADALEPAMASAERDAVARIAEATAVADTLQAAQALERTLGMALARKPSDIALADSAPLVDGHDAVGSLDAALDDYAASMRAVEETRLAVAEAAGSLAAQRQLVAAVERRLEQARSTVAAAREQLSDEAGDAATDPAAIRAKLAIANDAAAKLDELGTVRANAATDLAAARARLEMAQTALVRGEADAEARAGSLAVAETAQAAARRTFVEGWTARPVAREETAGEPSVAALAELMHAVEEERDANRDLLAVTTARIAEASKQTADAERMSGEIGRREAEGALAAALETDLRGPNFLAFVQQEAMQLLAADATHHFADFTSGRYELIAEPDQFAVVDRFNGDERRSVKTLSGGETFLASLALALSLSEHLPHLSARGGVVSLESLFLDEGFGSLDAESLDLAVQGLETLAGGRRMIGVISHVPELAERIPDRIEVVKGEHTSSIADQTSS